MADESKKSIVASLWGKMANDQNLLPWNVILVKGGKITDYWKKSLRLDNKYTRYEINPKDQTNFLKEFYKNYEKKRLIL